MTVSASRLVRETFAESLRPDPELTVSEWADRHRILSGKAASEKGPWRTSRTPYLREIMDCLSAGSPIQRVVFMKGAQLGATEAGNNWLGYIIHHCPAPTLMIYPTVEVARRVSRQRIGPMIESTPALRARVGDGKSASRDASDTAFMKDFPGGTLIMTGSNSAAGLRSMPIRNLFPDEIDEYEADVGNQGDPLALAEERIQTYGSRAKEYLPSTPTVAGFSRIDRLFQLTDRRRFYIPCPYCAHFDFLTWDGADRVTKVPGQHHRIEWEGDDPMTAHMVCAGCQVAVPEHFKTEMLSAGEWRPTAVGERGSAGYHLSGLYSPLGWRSWSYCATRFLRVKSDRFQFKTFVNTVWGETWEEKGDSVEPHALLARKDSPLPEGIDVPTGVGVLVAAVDVQDDRLEAKVDGYGAGEECWPIAWEQFYGDPGNDTVWLQLDRFLLRPWIHESRQRMFIEVVVVDSGGHHSDRVYRYCASREARLLHGVEVKTFAIRGGAEHGKPVVGLATRNNRYRTKLFTLCVNTAKDQLMSRLQLTGRGPGYMHIPAWATQEYVDQLTAEKGLYRYVPNRGSQRIWTKTRERNEVLDLQVYSYAALLIGFRTDLGSLSLRAKQFAIQVQDSQSEVPKQPTQSPAMPSRLNSWVFRHRR